MTVPFERVFDWSLMPRPQRSVTRACFLMERTFVQSAANAGSEPIVTDAAP